MPAKLKPLVLPQLVEGRKRLEDGQYATTEMVDGSITVKAGANNTNNAYGGLFLVDNASMSDITSPATPTFSHRSGGLGHLRYSSSTSSLDLPLSIPSPSVSECPASPTPATGLAAVVAAAGAATLAGSAPVKRPLPDVKEEHLLERVAEEHEYGDGFTLSHRTSHLYRCLCDEPCSHGRDDISYDQQDFIYDLGFVSDSEAAANEPSVQRHRHRASSTASVMSRASNATHDSAFSGLTLRFGSHIHALSRWRSKSHTTRRNYANLMAAPASEPSLSRQPSSRSSSLSAGQPAPVLEPAPILTPTLSSYYGSTESIEHFPTSGSAHEEPEDDSLSSLERDRTKAATPLLPPLMTESSAIQRQQPVSPLPPPSLQTSPLQSPAVASSVTSPAGVDGLSSFPLTSPVADAGIPAMSLSPLSPTAPTGLGISVAATAPTSPAEVMQPPPLRRQFSTASFYVPFGATNVQNASASAVTPATSAPISVPVSVAQEPHDKWCDRLGHANYTILPKPYHLAEDDTTDTQALHALCEDWAQARINYAKHLVRTGEHYGTTSNTYMLTEAKWAETEREWQRAHQAATVHITNVLTRAGSDARECAATPGMLPPVQHHDVSCVIPQILDNAEGKFPGLGDEDIVGPMDRVEYMEHGVPGFPGPSGAHGEKHAMSRFLRGLADRVRHRK
ncbi:hypothetical protein SPBR_05713 [Sporothrix brasiliensis 5110]|uniref:Only prolin and serin are matching in the corresponding protein n=1 Tax=Sporothrix brasiliensis 5110 TaxID=1398154 RepID=A0A0C2J5J8_9PEZI|nr:uncharacterized protein SPBR_05713 [Sporothrix brasiliensis 5110]KIH94265.1 hypothetical protein SPBR_05713 [Sporothrix brasiliensis 5110]